MRGGRIDPSPLVTKGIAHDDIASGDFKEMLADRDRHVKILERPA